MRQTKGVFLNMKQTYLLHLGVDDFPTHPLAWGKAFESATGDATMPMASSTSISSTSNRAFRASLASAARTCAGGVKKSCEARYRQS